MESSRRTLPENPRENSNLLSILTFAWTVPIFQKGYTKVLEFQDFYRPMNCDRSDSLGERLEM